MDVLKAQYEARAKDLEVAKAIVDTCATEDRAMTVDERLSFDRANEEFSRRTKMIEEIKAMSAHEAEVRAAQAGHEDEVRPVGQVSAPSNDVEMIRSLARGEIRSAEFAPERRENRDLLKSSTGAPVPTNFYDQVIMLARAVGPMLSVGTTLATASGENLQIPRLSTYSTGTVNAEGATLGESDAAFSAFITLNAYKYGFLTQVSRELIEDSGVNVLDLLAMNCGNALGFAVNTGLTTGTGTVEPTGILTAAGSGVTGGTGVSGAFTYANLVSLYYSLDPAARALPGTGFMAKGSSIAAMRTLQDGNGSFVFQPSMSESTPDRVLGVPLIENPAMAAAAVSAKSVIAGHFPSYYVRTVGGIRLDRSDDFAFSADLVTFRCTFRVDGNLPQSSHVKYFVGAGT